MKNRLVLIDGNAVFHRAYHALPPLSSASGEPIHAAYGFTMILLKVLSELKPTHMVVAFDTEGPTIRHKEFEEYKSQRPAPPEDLYIQLPATKKILDALKIKYYEDTDYEADDIIGTFVSKFRGIEKIIVTGDLDELQLIDTETRVYTMRKGFTDTVIYDAEAVKERFGFGPELIIDYKALRGDPSDNIPGVAGVGEKTATELILLQGTVENIYKNLPKIPEKIRAKLEAGRSAAAQSKKLVTIKKDMKIKAALDELKFGGFDRNKLAALFFELGFKSLINKIPASSAPEQGALNLSTPALQAEYVQTPKDKEIIIGAYLLNPARRDLTIPELVFTELHQEFDPTLIPKLKKKILFELKKQNLWQVFDQIERPLISVLEKMEGRGVLIDTAFLNTMSAELAKRLTEIEKKIYRLAGMEFNINSPLQVKDVIFGKLQLDTKSVNLKKTKTGLSTAASELSKLKGLHPIIDLLLEYRELAKLKTTYIDVLPRLIDPQTGRLKTTFNQTGTTTGRLSSSNPNLQNIPIRTELGESIRKAFIADPGKDLLSADYSQIELRIAAHLSNDPVMLKIFEQGEDFHASTAAIVYKKKLKDVDSRMRRFAKIVNFGVLYGMSSFGLAEAAGMSRVEAADFIKNYFSTFNKLAEYIQKIKIDARESGYVETLFGRKRFVPEIKSPNPMIRAGAERAAVNMPLQGTAADIIKKAMIEIDRKYPDLDMLLQVHDELLFEVDKKSAPIKELKKIMESAAELKAPLVVDIKIGQNWRDLKPLKI